MKKSYLKLLPKECEEIMPNVSAKRMKKTYLSYYEENVNKIVNEVERHGTELFQRMKRMIGTVGQAAREFRMC